MPDKIILVTLLIPLDIFSARLSKLIKYAIWWIILSVVLIFNFGFHIITF